MKKGLVIVDCVYDFIDGSLACEHAEEAVQNIIQYMNDNEVQVYYIREIHPQNHCSFTEYGGEWPAHAVEGTRGSKLHVDFEAKVNQEENKPSINNTYIKGQNSDIEQYSGFEAINIKGEVLTTSLPKEVIVCGIATEYCVYNTIKDLMSNGYEVEVLEEGLGYVNRDGHLNTVKQLKNQGIQII